MKFHKVKLLCLAFVCSIFLNANAIVSKAEAPTIDIDGSFQDWISASQQLQAISNSEFSGYAAFQDNEATYLHIVGKSNWIGLQGDSLKYVDDAQKEHTINFSGLNGDPFILSMKDMDYREIEGASMSGSIQNNNREWEIKLPKSVTGNITKFIFHNTEISNIPTLQDITSPEEPEIPVEPETPENPEEPTIPPTGNGIIIDGYFDDWTNLHHINIDWKNNVFAKACAVLDDEDSVCVHVGGEYREDRHLNLDNIRISVNNGPQTQIKLRQYNSDGSISVEPLSNIEKNKRYEMAANIQEGGITYKLGEANYATKMANNREDFEFCIDLTELEKALGLPEGSINSSSKIEFTFPSIGYGNIIIEGTTTGPLIGVGLCIAIVAVGFGLDKRRKAKSLK